MKTKLFLTGVALVVLTAFASAQDPVAGQGQGNGIGKCNGACKGSALVDANNDGVCDNLGKRTANMAGKKGNGTCNGKGQGQGKGKKFLDANQNGVCDTFEARTIK